MFNILSEISYSKAGWQDVASIIATQSIRHLTYEAQIHSDY